MRLSQPKGEAAEFQAGFEAALKDIHPGYERNKSARGVCVEYLREVAPGVFASHNSICKKGTYPHGFCLTLHRDLSTPYLNSPFVAGGRFDHNCSVNMAIQRDLGRHIILSDSHQFRRGYETIVARCTAQAEAILLPHYLSVFEQSRTALRALAEAVFADTEIPDDRTAIRHYSTTAKNWDCDMGRFSALFDQWRGESTAFLAAVLGSKPEFFKRLKDNKAIDPSML